MCEFHCPLLQIRCGNKRHISLRHHRRHQDDAVERAVPKGRARRFVKTVSREGAVENRLLDRKALVLQCVFQIESLACPRQMNEDAGAARAFRCNQGKQLLRRARTLVNIAKSEFPRQIRRCRADRKERQFEGGLQFSALCQRAQSVAAGGDKRLRPDERQRRKIEELNFQ